MNTQDLEAMDEQLTAYLDGELSTADAQTLERQLVDSEKLRLRLAELRRAYDMLDELPETPHNQRFTKSTLELVVKDLSATNSNSSTTAINSSSSSWFGWPKVLFGIFGLVIAGSLLGVAIQAWKIQSDLRELGLMASYPGIRDIHELNVAVKLSHEKEAIEVLKEVLKERMVPPIPDSIGDRKAWIAGLTQLQIAKLDSGRESIRKLSREKYDRLAKIESQIESRPDRNQLQDTINIVGLVMDRLPNSKRNDLEGLNQEQRIQYLKDQIYLAASIYYAAHMVPDDTKSLEQWSSSSFHAALIQDLQPTRSMDTKDLLNLLLFRRRLENGYQLDNQSDLIEELAPLLSNTGKSLITGVSRQDQLRVLYAWLMPERMNSNQVTLDAYEKLNANAKERIDLLDPEQAKRFLEELSSRPNQRNRQRP